MNHFNPQEWLERGAERPVINHSPLPAYAMDQLDYGMTIGIAVTRGGRKYVCWVGGGDNPKAFFLLARQEPGETRWSQPILVIDPHDPSLPCDRCTIVGTLWTDPLNRLWLFFNQTLEHFDGRSANWYIRCDNPDADAPVWTSPQYLYHGCTLNKPVVRANGEWLLPVSLWARHHISEPFQDCHRELDPLRMAHMFVSRDQGETWSRRGGVVFPDSRFDEHMTVELADGRLWMIGRTASGLMESFSADGGAGWSRPGVSNIRTVSSRTHLRRLRSGRLLLIKHGTAIDEAPDSRTMLTAFLSEDDGATWSSGLLLDDRNDISYPDSDQDADGVIYITYDRERARLGEILMARLREEDILAGRAHSPGCCLRRVILRPGGLGPPIQDECGSV